MYVCMYLCRERMSALQPISVCVCVCMYVFMCVCNQMKLFSREPFLSHQVSPWNERSMQHPRYE